MTSRITIEEGTTKEQFIDDVNANFENLFTPHYILLTDSRATQAIPSGVWTQVLFNTVEKIAGDSYLEDNAAKFSVETEHDSSGLWNAVWTVCWDNTQAGLGRHIRKIKNAQDGNDNPFAIPFPLGTQDMLYDPAAGITGEGAKSYQQCYMQPGLNNDPGSISYMTLWVYQNSGYTINLLKDGIQAPSMQFVRMDEVN